MNFKSSLWLALSSLFISSGLQAAPTAKSSACKLLAPAWLNAPLLCQLSDLASQAGTSPFAFELPLNIAGIRNRGFLTWDLFNGLRFQLGSYGRLKNGSNSSIGKKGFCCCGSSELKIREKQEREARIEKIEKERAEFIAQPDITLDMLLESLKEEGVESNDLPSELLRERLKTVQWLIEEMKKAGSPDGTAAEYRDTLEHQIYLYAEPAFETFKKWPGSDFGALQVLQASKEYRNATEELTMLHNAEIRWSKKFFSDENGMLRQRFKKLLQEFNNCHKQTETFLQQPNQEQAHTALNQLTQRVNRLQGFVQGLRLVMSNLDVRLKRLDARLFTRCMEAYNFMDVTTGMHQGLSYESYHTQIAREYRDCSYVPSEELKPLDYGIYQNALTKAQHQFEEIRQKLEVKI